MTFTSTSMISLVYLLICCCGPTQTHVSMTVSPHRRQFFQRESITLSCEEEDGAGGMIPVVGWSVKRQNSDLVNETCSTHWGTTNGESCTTTLFRMDGGLYWCESQRGDVSPAVSITMTDGDVILQSPVHAVPEGGSTTLRCLYRHQTTDTTSSDRPADFYHNGSLVSESAGQMSVHSVSRTHAGFYKCSISGFGQSPESWMEVTESSASPSPPSSTSTQTSATPPPSAEPAEPLMTLTQLIVKILVFTPYVISTFLYFSIQRDRARARARAAAANARNRRDNDVIMEVAV